MSAVRTAAARLLLEQFTNEASAWNAIATDPDDQSSFVRHGARARRDQLDWAIAQLKVALPAIEGEAVEADRVNNDRLLSILETVGDGWAEGREAA